jgi:hypothetical protein
MTATTAADQELGFFEELREQRWDDHRYYHQSYINQSLHLLSALSFLTTFALLPFHPVAAAIFGWIIAMWTRQIGHFFFEPKGWDAVNQASFEHKEEIKVGYNLQRKVVLHAVWAGLPLLLWLEPSLFGLIEPASGFIGWLRDVGLLWFWLGVAALWFRVMQLCAQRSALTAFAWAAKILTDPFHDAMLYRGAPLALLRGERIDPFHASRPH